MTTTIYIARHGETNWNAQARIQGQQDTILSEQGYRQRRSLFHLLKDEPIVRIYTSALQRTILTAQPLSRSQSCPLLPMEDLNELGFGIMEGISLTNLDDDDQALWDWWLEDPLERAFPGGESHLQLRDRIDNFLDNYEPPGDSEAILIVGHMRSNQMLLHRFLHLDLSSTLLLRQPNDVVYRLTGPEQPAVHHAILRFDGTAPVWEEGVLMINLDDATP